MFKVKKGSLGKRQIGDRYRDTRKRKAQTEVGRKVERERERGERGRGRKRSQINKLRKRSIIGRETE